MDPFIGEIRLLPYYFNPVGWLPCDGRILDVRFFQPLFAILGNKYGGDGKTTFAIPNLQGRIVVAIGDDPSDNFDPIFAQHGGTATVSLTANNMPPHTHTLTGAASAVSARSTTPAGNLLTGITQLLSPAATINPIGKPYIPDPATTPVNLASGTITPFAGGAGPHENRQPVLALQYCIAFDGEFPTRN